ncbi:MAG: PAS domain S-box protein [Desulfurivibrionaceae bacterium]
MNLRTQIFLAAFALGIIPLLTLVGVNLRGHIKRHEEVSLHQAEVRRQLEFTNLNDKIEHYRHTLEMAALLPETEQIVNFGPAALPSPNLVGLLSSWFSKQDSILEIVFYDRHDRQKIGLIRDERFFVPSANDQNGKKPPHRLLTEESQLILSKKVETATGPITASFRIDAERFLAKYLDSLWITPAGEYIHQPYSIKLTIAPGTNALEDFPRLLPLLDKRKAALWESASGFTVTWMPVILDGSRPALWIGTEVDRTAARRWKNSLITNIITITLIMAAIIFVIANAIAKKIDSIKEQILTGLDQVMNSNREFRFDWTGPKEIRTMAEDLSRLAQRYVTTMRAREEAENALRENQENFRNLTNSAQDAIVLMDHQGNISYWNQTAEEMFGYGNEEVLGKPIHPLISPRLLEERSAAEIGSQTSDEGPIRETIELITRRKDGSDLPVELSLSEARIKDKWHSIWIIRDISERKEAEENSRLQQNQLIQADKMASLGLLVSGMAHEINNPNSIALLNTPMLAEAWASVSPILDRYYAENGDFLVAGLEYSEMKEQIPKLFRELEESSKRIRTIVKDLKDYARQDNSRSMELLDLNEVARTAARLTGNLLKKSTGHFVERYATGLPAIRGNGQRLEQVVINLLQNSCDALANSEAAITIETGWSQDGQRVYLKVEDEGEGIPADALKRITDPFFTTKRHRGGTGLGLSVSAGIIKEHGGEIEFSSTGRGAVVTVTLPVPNNNPGRKGG